MDPMLRTLIFIAVVLLVLGGASVYMAERSMALAPVLAAHPAPVWGFFGAFVLLLFTVPVLQRWPLLGPARVPVVWTGYLLFGFVSTYLIYLAVADLGQALLGRIGLRHAGPWALGLALGATLVSLLLGWRTAMGPAVLRRVEVPIQDLPADLDGFTLVQISDLHLDPLVPMARVDQLVAAVNALAPDLIAVTGDLVDGEEPDTRAKVRRLAGIRARHGVCFVTGNHEYYSGVGHWLDLLRELGWTVLDNQHVLLTRGGARLAVSGMPDPAAATLGRGPDLAQALAGMPADAVPVLLFHPPTGFQAAAAAGVRLQLSGHTHAGQYFPWSLVVSALFTHARGLGRSGSMWIYTSVGTGFWGPPSRFLVPPELTLLTLRRA